MTTPPKQAPYVGMLKDITFGESDTGETTATIFSGGYGNDYCFTFSLPKNQTAHLIDQLESSLPVDIGFVRESKVTKLHPNAPGAVNLKLYLSFDEKLQADRSVSCALLPREQQAISDCFKLKELGFIRRAIVRLFKLNAIRF